MKLKQLNKNKLYISFLEAIYIVYMFNFFKTRYSFEFERPLLFIYELLKKIGIKTKYINHSMNSTIIPISHICPFGHFISWIIGAYLILRCFIPKLNKYNKLVLFLILVGSFLNINALVYLIPFFFIELLIINY